MKKILFITAALCLFSNFYAQETVTNRSGKEITVNNEATTTTKGIIKLAGDLGGTADSPTVPALTNKLDGTGTLNYVPKFSATKTLTNSLIFDDGTNVGIGITNPTSRFSNTATQIIGSNGQSSSSATGFTWANSNSGWGGSFWSDYEGLNVKVKKTSTIAFEVGSGTASQNNNGGAAGSTPLFKVLTNGNVGIGTTAPTGQLEVATTNAFSAIIRRASGTTYTSANLILQKTYNTDPAVSTAVGSGDYIGRILFSASNGTTTYPSTGPDIVGYAYGTQTSTTNGGGLVFRTVKDATSTVVERLKIDHNGNVGIGVTPPSSTGTLIGSPAAILDIKSDNSGVLVPRMTTTQRTAITVSASLDALLVYDTDVRMFYYYNAGTSSWTPINVGTINTQSGTTYTLSAADNGRVLDFTSATSVTLTVPSTLPVGFQVSITQAGAGQVTITGGSGMTVNNRYSATKTSGQWAKAGLEVRASGSAVLSGDVQ